jgi:AraC-like DNA-binding protein
MYLIIERQKILWEILDMIQTLTQGVLIITGFQLILLAVVLLAQTNVNRLNRNLLVAFLLSKAFLISRWLTFHFQILGYDDHPYFYHISASGFFLLAPLLYFYTKSLCYKDFAFKKLDLVHLIPFVLIIVFKAVSMDISLSESGSESSVLYRILVSNHWEIFWTTNLIQILSYILAMRRTLHIYQSKLRNLYSSVDKINLNWLHALLLLIFLHWLFVTSRAILSALNIHKEILLSLIDLYSITIFLIFTTILVIKGLNQLKIFSGIEEKPKYATSKLTGTDIQKYARKLIHYMKTHKPYLTASLTIDDLSEKLSVPSWQLSQVINEYFHQNYFNFVNRYRIEEAKQLLTEYSNGRRTVLEVLYEVGFNTKSAFNIAFKKHTGMTPTEFKNSHQNELTPL